MTVHAKTCINPVRMPMHLFHQETQVNAPRCEHECRRTHSPMALCFFQSHLGVFFRAHLGFFAAHSLQMQAQTSLHFFRMYLTFGKNRSLLLAEQEVGPNSFITDIEVVTTARDITASPESNFRFFNSYIKNISRNRKWNLHFWEFC